MVKRKLHFGGHPFALVGRLLCALSPRGYEKRWSFIFRPSSLELDLAAVKG
jgi:hypothetical protein